MLYFGVNRLSSDHQLTHWVICRNLLLLYGLIVTSAHCNTLSAGEVVTLPFRAVVTMANDPWIFATPSNGVIYDLNEDRVLELCRTGLPFPNAHISNYEDGAVLVPPPSPIPLGILEHYPEMTEATLLRALETGACLGYTGGVLVTKDYRVFFGSSKRQIRLL